MKQFTSILLLVLPFVGFTQDNKLFGIFPLVNGKVNYHDTIQVPVKTPQYLQQKIISWLNDSSAHLHPAIDTAAKPAYLPSSGTCKDYFITQWKQPGNLLPKFKHLYHGDNNMKVEVWYTLKVRPAGTGYSYEFTDFMVNGSKYHNYGASYVRLMLENITTETTDAKAHLFAEEVDDEIKKIIQSLSNYMRF